jgi:hypothetical protein
MIQRSQSTSPEIRHRCSKSAEKPATLEQRQLVIASSGGAAEQNCKKRPADVKLRFRWRAGRGAIPGV